MPNDEPQITPERLHLTQPDYVVYVPGSLEPTAEDHTNEHFLVFDGPDGSLMVIWTQSWDVAGVGAINRTVFARSTDEGHTWTSPRVIAGPQGRDDPTHMTSWAFPMVSRSGRIYVVYNAHKGIKGWVNFHTGTMAGLYSDDCGQSWSPAQEIPIAPSRFDDPAGQIPPEWIVWQKPMRDLSGGYFVGYSRWISPGAATARDVANWTYIDSVIQFMRFTNIDADPKPRDLVIRWSPAEQALRVPHREQPLVSVAQEPSIVRLPDQRLFCVMRSATGYIWWSQSADDGETWCSPRPLLHRDFGLPLLNPCGSDPLYSLSDGRYVLFYHNNVGGSAAGGLNAALPRDPVFVSAGEYRPNAEQPVWFSQPRQLMALDGVTPDGVKRPYDVPLHAHLSLYSSFTNRNGNDVFWYPDCKFFLLGKKIEPQTLAGLAVPD